MKATKLEKSMFLLHLYKYGLNETQNLNTDIILTFQAKDCALGKIHDAIPLHNYLQKILYMKM